MHIYPTWKGQEKREMTCYAQVFHNKHFQSHQTVSCRAVLLYNVQVPKWGNRVTAGEVRQRACAAIQQRRLLSLMA